jgi:archaellum biogenesis protein FlaJ (TadC family)
MSKQDKDAAEMAAEDKKAFAISKINETYRDFMNLGADPKVLNELINQRSAVKVTGFDKNTKNSIKTGKIQKEKLFK